MLVAAGLVALATRWWWTPLAGLVVSAFLLLGGAVASNTRDHLGDPSEVGVFIGTVIQPLALVIALVASVAATRQGYQSRPGHEELSRRPAGRSVAVRRGRQAPSDRA